MKMRMRTAQFLTAALVASSAALFAQAENWHKEYIAMGFNFAHGHAHDMTQKTWGGLSSFTAEFGIQFKHPQSNISVRPNFGYVKMTGNDPTVELPAPDPTKPKTGLETYDLMGLYVGAELVHTPFKKLPISITAGPSFFTWNVDQRAATGNPNQGDKGMKFGWRLGAGYDITPKYRVELAYTWTEWRTISSLRKPQSVYSVWVPGYNPSRPAYFCLKASYSF